MLLAATSAVIGALVTSIAPLRTRSTGLVAALVGGQLLGHIGMGWDSGHLHHGDAQLTPAMIGAHTAAALAAALVIRGAEFAYRVATAVLTQVVRVLGNPQPADDLAPLRTTHTDRVILRVFAADTARTRAPPLAACF